MQTPQCSDAGLKECFESFVKEWREWTRNHPLHPATPLDKDTIVAGAKLVHERNFNQAVLNLIFEGKLTGCLDDDGEIQISLTEHVR